MNDACGRFCGTFSAKSSRGSRRTLLTDAHRLTVAVVAVVAVPVRAQRVEEEVVRAVASDLLTRPNVEVRTCEAH